MQVRRAASPRIAYKGDDLSPADSVATFYAYTRVVTVPGSESIAVFNDHQPAQVLIPIGENHDAVPRGSCLKSPG